MKTILTVLIFKLLLGTAFGQSLSVCFHDAAVYYGVSEKLLMAIANVESGFDTEVVRKNRNGSRDIGIMQINSFWFPQLKKYGIEEEDLLNPCTNIFVGAWILRQCVDRYGYTWKAVGCYHSLNPERQVNYARKVYNVLRRTK